VLSLKTPAIGHTFRFACLYQLKWLFNWRDLFPASPHTARLGMCDILINYVAQVLKSDYFDNISDSGVYSATQWQINSIFHVFEIVENP
jgi:hypothetical protein